MISKEKWRLTGMADRAKTATATTAQTRARHLPALPRAAEVPRPPGIVLGLLVMVSALWGLVVDTSLLPVLSPTENSTIIQASTAAFFALLGILYGPWAGAAGGLVRDGTAYLTLLALQPEILLHRQIIGWTGHAVVDIIEDVLLGLIPALVARRTRRLDLLMLATAGAAWISLPFLTAGTVLAADHPGQIWTALTTLAGDWNEPVDPGLTVYALLAAGYVALALARWTTRPRAAVLMAAACMVTAAALIAIGAHP
jgi:hypothetical protein